MKWRVLVYKDGENGITRFDTVEDAIRYVEAIKGNGGFIAIEHVGKYTITRVVEYMDGREL